MLAYFDCFSGLAGDMIVAALLDAGADHPTFRNELTKLNLPEFDVEITPVRRAGLAAKLFTVSRPPTDEHRSLSQILTIIHDSTLSDRVKRHATDIFRRLADAEAKVHQCTTDDVHFHEVGAVDSIVDIIGVCVCLEILNIDNVQFPCVPVGSGTVTTDHGVLPVPAPATAELLVGHRVCTDGEGERTTPTGAAIVTTLGQQVSVMPELTIKSLGYGAGTRTHEVGPPNVLRVILGEPARGSQAQVDQVAVLSCQLDDMTGEQVGYLAEQLWNAGSLDVVVVPIYMKKNRPAVMLEIVVRPADADRLADVILRESTSFGVRRTWADRYKLARDMMTVEVPGGRVDVKLGRLGGKVVQVSPEYEDCQRLAAETDAPLRNIYRQAEGQAWRQIGDKDE